MAAPAATLLSTPAGSGLVSSSAGSSGRSVARAFAYKASHGNMERLQRRKAAKFIANAVSIAAPTVYEVKECSLPTWADFDLGRAPIFWKTMNGLPPTSGEMLTIFYNPAASGLDTDDDFGVAFNGGFNQPVMCGGEPRAMTRKTRGKADPPIYTIKICIPKHAVSLIFSFTNGVDWDGPYKLEVQAIKAWRNKPVSFFNENGASVEAVIMRYDTRLGKYDGKARLGGPRSTLCISSQVGCKMGCKFCATGSMGFKKNLSSGEIVEQLVHASRFSQIRNIVFMGMGEPLNNYAAVVEAIDAMLGLPFQISAKRITVSTVGIIHGIKKLQEDLPNVNLAVSLHAPEQDIRCMIMPAAKAFPLGRLMETLQDYQKKCEQKIFIEYIMLDGINDLEQHAHQLGKLLESLQVVVNLIPFNPIGTSSGFKTSTDQNVKIFQRILRGVYNIRTTIRKQMGQDISGACGQLVLNLSEQRSVGGASLLRDIEDLSIQTHRG